MSKIHQAMQKAEREGQPEVTEVPKERRDLLGDIFPSLGKEVPATPPSEEFEGAPAFGLKPKMALWTAVSSVQLDIQGSSKLVSYLDPKSIASEQYRALKTKVLQLYQTRGLKSLLVTGAGMSEGKTVTATNLALTMSQEISFKVLLVDADLRRPSIHRFLGINVPWSLSDHLAEKCGVEQVIYSSQLENFHVVPGGSVPSNPAELLNSHRMRSFMTFVSERFDCVVLDSPPVPALSDADILASMTDGVLVVVRALQTPADFVEKAMEALKGRNILGTVLNGYEDDKAKNYSYYYHRTELERKALSSK